MSDTKRQWRTFTFGVLTFVFALFCQIIVAQYIEAQSLRRELRIAERALNIEASQVADLTYQLQQSRIDQSAAATQNFVSGVVSAVEERDRYNEIWHAGYDRGAAVQQYVNSLDTTAQSIYTQKNDKNSDNK